MFWRIRKWPIPKRVLAGIATVILGVGASGPLVLADGASGTVTSPSGIATQWANYQGSSATDVQKVEETASLFAELPLLNKYDQTLTLPDFLMTANTPDKTYWDNRLTYFFDGLRDWGNAWATSINYTPTVDSVSISGDKATIAISPHGTETVQGISSTVDYPFVQHTLQLVQVNGQWLISSDQFSDEFKTDFGTNPDWKSLIGNLASKVAKEKATEQGYVPAYNKNTHTYRSNTLTTKPWNTVSPTGVTYWYPSSSAVYWYATTYTDNSDTSSSTNYNPLFVNENPNGGDCTNFVSQVIWYGVGGQNNSTAIQNHYVPMTAYAGVTNPWYADNSSATSAWDNVFDFIADAEENYTYALDGPQIAIETVSSVMPGDPVEDTAPTNGHMLVVSDNGSDTWDTVRVSAHNNNHDNELIMDIYGSSQPSTLYFYQMADVQTS